MKTYWNARMTERKAYRIGYRIGKRLGNAIITVPCGIDGKYFLAFWTGHAAGIEAQA